MSTVDTITGTDMGTNSTYPISFECMFHNFVLLTPSFHPFALWIRYSAEKEDKKCDHDHNHGHGHGHDHGKEEAGNPMEMNWDTQK